MHVTGVWKTAADCCVVWSVALAPASQTGKEWPSFRVQLDSCSLRGCQIHSLLHSSSYEKCGILPTEHTAHLLKDLVGELLLPSSFSPHFNNLRGL